MLHVVPRFSVRSDLRRAGIPGEVLAWEDELFVGPTPAGLDEDAWREVRAQFLAQVRECDPEEAQAMREASRAVLERFDDDEEIALLFTRSLESTWGYGVPEVRAVLEAQDAELARFLQHEEVVLWASASLPDQLLLARHLDWFSGQEMGATRLSVVCIGETRGRGRRVYPCYLLGGTDPDDLEDAFLTRARVTAEEYRTARRAWAAFRAPDPRSLERLLRRGLAAVPYLREGLVLHLQQLPSVRNGLNQTENAALAGIPKSGTRLVNVDLRVMDSAPGLGCSTLDLVCRQVEELSRGRFPAVKIGPPVIGLDGERRWLARKVKLTDVGRDLLAGRADWVRLNGIDRWLGGVHLQGEEAAWRWDEDAGRLVGA